MDAVYRIGTVFGAPPIHLQPGQPQSGLLFASATTGAQAVIGETRKAADDLAAGAVTGAPLGTTSNTANDTAIAVDAVAVSFKDFYATHHDKLSRALSLYFGSEDIGVEAADEAFTRAYERWTTVSQHPNPYGWTYVVGTNRARSVLRRRATARNKQHLVAPERLQDVTAKGASEEATDFDTKDAVYRLRPALRSVVIARFYLEMSVDETAAALGVRSGTVKSRLSRALEQLRSDLDQDGAERAGGEPGGEPGGESDGEPGGEPGGKPSDEPGS